MSVVPQDSCNSFTQLLAEKENTEQEDTYVKCSPSLVRNRDGTPTTTPTRTPTRTPVTRRKELLSIGGIEIEKKRRTSACYNVEENKITFENSKGEIEELEILETSEKHGIFRRALPLLPVPLAAFCFLLNLFPGLGTLLSAFLLFCKCGKAVELEGGSTLKGAAFNFLVAFLQFVLSPLIVGWIWSIQRGALMLQEAVRFQINLNENPGVPQIT